VELQRRGLAPRARPFVMPAARVVTVAREKIHRVGATRQDRMAELDALALGRLPGVNTELYVHERSPATRAPSVGHPLPIGAIENQRRRRHAAHTGAALRLPVHRDPELAQPTRAGLKR